MSTNTCPICNKDDAIQKVSALVTGGRSSGTFSGPSGGSTYVGGEWVYVSGHATLSGSSETDLARLLASPPSPKQPNIGRTLNDFVILTGLFLLTSCVCSGTLQIAPSVIDIVSPDQPLLDPPNSSEDILLVWLIVGICLFVSVLTPIIISIVISNCYLQ